MKEVISASRRTDIPAFYLKWFMIKVKDQNVTVSNPFNRNQFKKVSLSPKDVAWIVFWSRNYHLFLKNYNYFDQFRLFFHFTINPPNRILEPDMIPTIRAFNQLERMARIFGPECIIWRYDPVVFYRQYDQVESNHDINLFRQYVRMAESSGLKKCYISIIHLYAKVLNRAQQADHFTFITLETNKRNELLQEMIDTASLYGIQLYSCSNDDLLEVSGIHKGQCINGKLLNDLGSEAVSVKPQPTRPDCGCTVSIDIGDYVTTGCRYHCLYCYARK
jgi:hypothetical protein